VNIFMTTLTVLTLWWIYSW